MKKWIFLRWYFGIVLAALPLAGGCQSENANPPPVQTNTAIQTAPAVSLAPGTSNSALGTMAPTSVDMAAEPPPANLEDAPLKPLGSDKPLPVSVRATSPTAEIIKMANAGVDQGVMLTFVTNCPSTFNLGADEIIYLNDIGVPSDVVTTMIQHDQALKANAAAALTASVPVYTAPTNAEPPVLTPEQVAPQAMDTGTPYPAETATVATYPEFYNSLSPYGTWMEVPGYGLCWQPTVVVINAGWSPYVDCGRWMYSDCGWYWYSDYSWGWAPFHYGRWFHHNSHGWCWVPGRTWGPAWVSWRYTDSHCGWAPLPPGSHYYAGYGWSFHGRRVDDHYGFGIHEDRWHFVANAHMQDRHPGAYAVRGPQAAGIYRSSEVGNHMEVRNNRLFNRGIGPERVEAATRSPIRAVTIRPVTESAGTMRDRGERLENGGKTLAVYRPQVTSGTITRPAGTRSTSAPGVAGATRKNLEARETIEPLGYRNRTTTASTTARPAGPTSPAPSVGAPRAGSAAVPTAAPGSTPRRDPPTAVSSTARPSAPSTAAPAPRVTTPAVSVPSTPARSSSTSQASPAARPASRPSSLATTSQRATPATTPAPGPTYRTPTTVTATPAPQRPTAPAPTASSQPRAYTPSAPSVPRYSAPATVTSPQRPAPATPSYTPSAPSVPRYSAPAPSYSAPARSTPSYTPSAPSVPRYSAPAQPSYSAPARSTPAPSQSYSAPAPAPSRPSSPAPSASQSRPSQNSGGNSPRNQNQR